MAQHMIRRRSLITFSSTVWGNVEVGEFFEFAEGYNQSLIDGGYIAPDKPAPVAPVAVETAGLSLEAGPPKHSEPQPDGSYLTKEPAPPADDFTAALTGQAPRRGPGRPRKHGN